jgi:hypothetical protein
MAFAISSMVLGSITGISLATNLSHNVIKTSVQSSFDLIKNFVTYHHTHIKEVIDEFDLLAKLEIIEAVMKDIENENINDKKSVTKSLDNLRLVVENIHNLLKKIDNIIKEHEQKYFSKWRTIYYENEILELKRNIRLMDLRYNMFLEILKVR